MATIQKMLTAFAGNEVRKLARRAIGIHTRGLVDGWFAEKPEKTAARVRETLGYDSTHYKLGKDNEIQFQLSAVFVCEWLTNSPEMIGRLIKDEESGQLFLDEKPLDTGSKVKLINRFLEICKIQARSVHSSFEQAFKLLQSGDLISNKFKTHFATEDETTDVLDNWLVNCFGDGMETNPAYAQDLFKRWIVGTARRAIYPGEPLDGCLTFTGPTNTGKTRFFRLLLPPPFEERTTEVLGDIKEPRKLIEAILGRTVVCFDELAVLDHPKVIETFKQLITKQAVDARLAYRRDPQRYNLRQGFGATTNKTKFIQDPTLSRRLWVIELNGKKMLNFDYLLANREQLWREAVKVAQTDFSVYLSAEQVRNVEIVNTKYVV